MSEELDIDSLAGPESVEVIEDAVDQQAEPVAETETEPEARPAESDSKTVPLAVLLEERAKFKQQQERFQSLEQELRAVREQRQQQAAPPPPAKADEPPDYVADPKGYIEWQRQQAEKQINEQLKPIQQHYQQTEQQRQQEALVTQIVSKASEYESEFVQHQPDYMDALQHVRIVRMREAEAMGIPPQMAQQQLRAAELQLAAYALQNGKDPALLAYNLAKSLGYGQQSQQAARELPEADKSEMAAKREKAQGMGGSGGGDIESALSGTDDEFAEAMAEMFGRKR